MTLQDSVIHVLSQWSQATLICSCAISLWGLRVHCGRGTGLFTARAWRITCHFYSHLLVHSSHMASPNRKVQGRVIFYMCIKWEQMLGIFFHQAVLFLLKDSEQPWAWRKVKKCGVSGFRKGIFIKIKAFSLLVFPWDPMCWWEPLCSRNLQFQIPFQDTQWPSPVPSPASTFLIRQVYQQKCSPWLILALMFTE